MRPPPHAEPPGGSAAPRRKKLRARQPLGRDRRKLTKRPWLIEKFAMRGELTVLISPPGVGKTTLTQQVSHTAAAGREWASFPVAKPLKVLVFHWEDDEEEMDRKVQAIEERMGLLPQPENLITVYCGAGNTDDDDDDLILATYNAETMPSRRPSASPTPRPSSPSTSPTSSSSIRWPIPSRVRKATSC